MSNSSQNEIRVLLSCSGVGILSRGIETFARECFDGLHGTEGLDIRLIKGRGERSVSEKPIPVINRESWFAETLGKMTGRNGYFVEQLSSVPFVIAEIRRFRPHVVFTSESNLMFQLYWWRKKLGLDFRILFSNGGPCHPPYIRRDHVQQVTPHLLQEALDAGEPETKHSLVPYGINVPQDPFLTNQDEIKALRKKLDLPTDKPLVISVGWISTKSHKRPQWLISEMAKLPEPRPHLLMLGYMDENTEPVLKQAREQLGEDGFTARSVSYDEVVEHYKASDLFALTSLQEGFGRVYLEALMYGLPVIAHDFPVMRYVMKEEGTYCDCSKEGDMAEQIQKALRATNDEQSMRRRRDFVDKNFSWKNLAPEYLEMFHRCRKTPL